MFKPRKVAPKLVKNVVSTLLIKSHSDQHQNKILLYLCTMGEKINLIKFSVKPLLGVLCLLVQVEKGPKLHF